MKPILLWFNFLVITLAEMLVSHALQKTLLPQDISIDSPHSPQEFENKRPVSTLPEQVSRLNKSHQQSSRLPEHQITRYGREDWTDSTAKIVRRTIPVTLSRRSPMQNRPPGFVKTTAAGINQSERDAEARRRAREAEIAEARERSRTMSPPRANVPQIPAGPSTSEQQASSQSQASRPASPVQRPPSSPSSLRTTPAARPPSPPPIPPQRPPSPPLQSSSSSSSTRQAPRRLVIPPLPLIPSREPSPTRQTPRRRITLPLPVTSSREPSPDRRIPSTPQSSPTRQSSPVAQAARAQSWSPTRQPSLSRISTSAAQNARSRSSSPIRQRPSPQQSPTSSSRQLGPLRQATLNRMSLTRQSSIPQSSTPRQSSPSTSSIQILSAQSPHREPGDPSPFQASSSRSPSSRSQPGTPSRLSRQASSNSADSYKTAGSSVKDASDPAALEEALRRSQSLPTNHNAEDYRYFRSVQSASQPASPRQRSPLRITNQRTVSISNNLQIIELSKSTPTTPRSPTVAASRPLRSALRGSTGNLVGMVRPLDTVREHSIETPGAGVPPEPLLPLEAMTREGLVSNPGSTNTSPTTSRASSLHRALSLQRATSLPRGEALPEVDGRRTPPLQTPRAAVQPTITPNHVGSGPVTQPPSNAPGTLRRNTVAGGSSTSIASMSQQGNGGDRSNRGGRVSRMSTQLSARLGEAHIENERHPGKFSTTVYGTMLSGGIVGGIITGINHHSAASIAGGSLAGTCVGLTGIVGTCYFMQNARTTVERENIPLEERLRRGHEALQNMTLTYLVPRRARNTYRSWRGLPPIEDSRTGSSEGSQTGPANAVLDGANNGGETQGQPQNANPSTPRTQSSIPSPFAPHPNPDHPEHIVRRGLSIHPHSLKSWRLEFR